MIRLSSPGFSPVVEPQPYLGHLHPEALKAIRHLSAEFELKVNELLAPPIASTESGEPDRQLDTSAYDRYRTAWSEGANEEYVDGLARVDTLQSAFDKVIQEEFRAVFGSSETGLGEDATRDMQEAATESMKRAAHESTVMLDSAQLRHLSLIDYFFDSGFQSKDIAERLEKERIRAMRKIAGNIRESVEEPGKLHPFRRRVYDEAGMAQSHSVRSAFNTIPTREQVTEDYLQGVRAALKRSVYGWRLLVLDRGLDSDDSSQIDSFQREHYEFFGDHKGGEYIIALTPGEYAEKYLRAQVMELLYGDGEVSRFLDQKVADDSYAASSRDYRKHTARRSYDESRIKQDARNQGDDSWARAHANETMHSQQAAAQNLAPEMGADWSDTQRNAYQDMLLFFDTQDLRNISEEDKRLILTTCWQVIGEMRSRQYTPANPVDRHKTLRSMQRHLHPDRNPGAETASKIVNALDSTIQRN